MIDDFGDHAMLSRLMLSCHAKKAAGNNCGFAVFHDVLESLIARRHRRKVDFSRQELLN
jgi:hypothetical protein